MGHTKGKLLDSNNVAMNPIVIEFNDLLKKIEEQTLREISPLSTNNNATRMINHATQRTTDLCRDLQTAFNASQIAMHRPMIAKLTGRNEVTYRSNVQIKMEGLLIEILTHLNTHIMMKAVLNGAYN